jgi:dsRNA-specific ribonuclease
MLRKYPQAQLRIKDKADLVESFLGALYIDRGLLYCRRFCRVCFFPRLKVGSLDMMILDSGSGETHKLL